MQITIKPDDKQNISELSSDSDRWLDKENLGYDKNKESLPDVDTINLLEKEIKILDLENKKLQLQRDKTEQKLKEDIFHWTKKVVSYYLLYVGVVIAIVSIKIPLITNLVSINLNDGVIITLLATTTATIIGLPYLIIHSLFPKDKTDKNSKNSN